MVGCSSRTEEKRKAEQERMEALRAEQASRKVRQVFVHGIYVLSDQASSD